MTKKKVLHISKYYYPHVGGIEDVCRTLVNGMPEYDIRVLCFNDTNSTMVTYDNGVEVTHASSFCKLASQAFSFSIYKFLKKELKTFKPDIIHIHLPNPLLSLYLVMALNDKTTKVVVHWHSDIVEQKFLYTFIKPIETALLKRANRIIATTPNYLEGSPVLKDYKDKAAIVACSVSLNKMNFHEEDKAKVEALKQKYCNRPIVFFMGRHVPYKGIDYLIRSEKHVKSDCVFLIAGKGPITKDLEKQAATSERIKFVGKIPDEEIKVYMHASTVFAFPSITKNEAFGVVLAEAMYCGAVPITYTIDCSGVNWVSVNGKTGIEVANRDIVAYAKAIDTLINDPALRQRYSEEAHKRIATLFTPEVICNGMRKVYESLD